MKAVKFEILFSLEARTMALKIRGQYFLILPSYFCELIEEKNSNLTRS
jgi:hypothetical protein